ncbi:MAG TPA: hypothetical protein VHZ73_08255 [Vicinamibacterales bacterium]|jgi:hypothetical protein|nr:hypothetical protein [Vicinamibacterales bacterium]
MITTQHKLLTHDWTSDVRAIEAAIDKFPAGHPPSNDCRVVLFEIAQDRDLHVNVTHSHETKPVKGWAGPGGVPDGFVNNRTFGGSSPERIAGHIRDMVFAARV